MFLFKKKLNSSGFGHIELTLLVIVVVGISGVGYSVYKHLEKNTVNTYTALTSFVSNGIPFTEKACIASQTGTAPNYIDTVTALISVNEQAGPRTEVIKNGNVVTGTGYNPLAFYSIDGIAPVTEDNWVTSSTSTIKFNLVPSISSASFNLGVEATPGLAIPTPGSSQTIGSLTLCNAPIKVSVATPKTKTIIPVIKTVTSGATTTTTTTIVNPATKKTTTTTATTNTVTKKTTTTTTTTPTTPTSPTTPTTPTTPPATPAPTISLSAAPTSLTSGSASVLTWSSTNATSCTASGAWSGSKATSGSITTSGLTITSSYSLSCSGAGGTTLAIIVVTVTAPTTCASSPPTTSNNPLYPLSQVENFSGTTLPSVWRDYGNEVQQPSGYVAADHAVFVPGTGFELQGYPDSISGNIGGVTGGSGAVLTYVPSSGGYDVCFSMSSGNWQDVHLVLISWPTDNNWNEGENDFFEGNPQDMEINVHEIGSSPQTNVWQGTWPSTLGNGSPHLISTRWDPINGYRFYLDGTLVATAPISSTVTTPTTSHFLSMQMQDMDEASTSTETATIHWTASYGYSN